MPTDWRDALDETCELCFWFKYEWPQVKQGICKKHAPIILSEMRGNDPLMGRWPAVEADEPKCGDFVVKEG